MFPDRPLKVLIFNNSHQWGYQDRLLYNLLTGLHRHHTEVTLICPDQASIVSKLGQTTFKVQPIPYSYGQGPFVWKQVYSVWTTLKQLKPDIFHLVGRETLYPWSLLLSRRPEFAFFVSIWDSSLSYAGLDRGQVPFWQRPMMSRLDGLMVAHRDDEDFFSHQLRLPARKIFPMLPSMFHDSATPNEKATDFEPMAIGVYVPRELLDEGQAREVILQLLTLANDLSFSVDFFIDQDIAGSYLTDGLNKLIQKHASLNPSSGRFQVKSFIGAMPPMEGVGVWLSLFTPKEGPDLLVLEAIRRQRTAIAVRHSGSMLHYAELSSGNHFHTYHQGDMRELRQILISYRDQAPWKEQPRQLKFKKLEGDIDSFAPLLERYRRAVAKRSRYIHRYQQFKS